MNFLPYLVVIIVLLFYYYQILKNISFIFILIIRSLEIFKVMW